jgi:hypothetical protein
MGAHLRVQVKDMTMLCAMRQMSLGEQAGDGPGEARQEPVRDEVNSPRHETKSTGSALLKAFLV